MMFSEVSPQFWHFDLGNLLTIITMAVIGLWFIFKSKADVDSLKTSMAEMRDHFDKRLTTVETTMVEQDRHGSMFAKLLSQETEGHELRLRELETGLKKIHEIGVHVSYMKEKLDELVREQRKQRHQ